jgi:formylglycine-generating enzyme required for sulfatase activity
MSENYPENWEKILQQAQVWCEPYAFVDNMVDTGREIELWGLVGTLLDADPPKPGELSGFDSRWWLVWLAATVVQKQKLYLQTNLNQFAEQSVRDGLVAWLVALLETPQVLPPPERALCGRVLGLLGDSRSGVGVEKKRLNGREIELPQIEWRAIPAPSGGKFVMGTDSEKNNPCREVALDYSFKMSKYLITYQQFQTFVDSGEYDDPRWWRDFPEEYQPQPIGEQYYEYDNHPRDTVSWYQAVAFTRWLTTCYRAAGELGKNEELRLPTEIEWEYAARGADQRTYPYGNEFDLTKANTIEAGIGMTSAVGCFPDGASPFGVLDMSGNVNEWCLNKSNAPEVIQADSSIDFRVRRGGAFYFNGNFADCVFRNCHYPYLANFLVGVRVMVASYCAFDL